MVGWVLRLSSDDDDLPAHRVVNRAGVLTGAPHFGEHDEMRNRLLAEGVTFLDDITVDMERHLWDPAADPWLDDLFRPPD